MPPKLTWKSLGEDLGFSQPSLREWKAMDGAPQTPDRDEWIRFIADKGLGNSGNRVGGDREELLKQKLEREIAILDAKLDKEHRRSIAKSEVDRLLLQIASRSRSMLYQFLETDAPPRLDGLTAAQQRPILREMADSICDSMADMIKGLDEA